MLGLGLAFMPQNGLRSTAHSRQAAQEPEVLELAVHCLSSSSTGTTSSDSVVALVLTLSADSSASLV